jgi:hypothetical protein
VISGLLLTHATPVPVPTCIIRQTTLLAGAILVIFLRQLQLAIRGKELPGEQGPQPVNRLGTFAFLVDLDGVIGLNFDRLSR